MKTVDIWANSRGHSRCRGCNAPIEWAEIVKTGRRMCFDRIVVSDQWETAAGRTIQTVDLEKNHWATCPDREQFRRKRA